MDQSKPTTFAEAYQALKKKEMREQRQPRRQSDAGRITSTSDFAEALSKVKRMLEGEDWNEMKVKNIKVICRCIQSDYSPLVVDWIDSNGFDILHLAILYDCPEIVAFLLTDTPFFPSSHKPSTNPYAHLAAYTGHTQCLSHVLQNRPHDFFPISKPAHVVRIPESIKKKLRICDYVRTSSRKNMDKLLERIKSNSAAAESLLHAKKGQSDEDVADRLKKELSSLEGQSARSRVSGRKPVPPKERKSAEPKSPGAAIPSKTLPDGKLEKRSEIKQSEKADQDEEMVGHFKRKLKPSDKNKHIITVYWDTVSDFPPGIVNNIGKPVLMEMAENAHLPRKNIHLDIPVRSTYHRSRSDAKLQSERSRGRLHSITLQPQTSGTFTHSRDSITLPTDSNKGRMVSRDLKGVELGVRGVKKYKDFQLKIEKHEQIVTDESKKEMGKTPLTLAAERGHLDCVQLILETYTLKNNPMMTTNEPLTLATKARCPEAIMLLLEKRLSRGDYQSAVLLSIREMYPECLGTLLLSKSKERSLLFDGTNLFHILYSQSLMANYRYEMMPEMTRVLINSREDVNAHCVPRTYPMYTLISCAFNISKARQIFYYIDCLKLLLEARANPHYNEEILERGSKNSKGDQLLLSRHPFSSATHCIFESARNATNFFERSYWANLFLKKFITTLETCDRTNRRVLNHVFFEYMTGVCQLGVDRTIIRTLLRYGGNPDIPLNGKYAINIYFDKVFPYVTKFEIIDSYSHYIQELKNLMILCRGMTPKCLKEAQKIFLDEHFLSTPVQAMPVCRHFLYLLNNMTQRPRPLIQLAASVIWLRIKRNVKKARLLPLPSECLSHVIP